MAVAATLEQLVTTTEWSSRTIAFVTVVTVGKLMVGFAEELYVRGILLTAVRAHHGETLTLLLTSIVFGLAHVPGSLIAGVPLGGIVFQVGALGLTAGGYYWVRRVTGRLWPAMLVHAFSDRQLYLSSGAATSTPVTGPATNDTDYTLGAIGGLLAILTLISLSVTREDLRHRRTRRAADTSPPPA